MSPNKTNKHDRGGQWQKVCTLQAQWDCQIRNTGPLAEQPRLGKPAWAVRHHTLSISVLRPASMQKPHLTVPRLRTPDGLCRIQWDRCTMGKPCHLLHLTAPRLRTSDGLYRTHWERCAMGKPCHHQNLTMLCLRTPDGLCRMKWERCAMGKPCHLQNLELDGLRRTTRTNARRCSIG
jgi:hypothetical protein